MESERRVDSVCPECGAKLRVIENMKSSYCRVCGSKVSTQAALNKEFSKELCNSLSAEQYYSLLKDENGRTTLEQKKKAAKMGSESANLDLGKYYYFEAKDAKSAIPYFEYAAKKNSTDAMMGKAVCELVAFFNSSGQTSIGAETLLLRYQEIDKDHVTIFSKASLSSYEDFVKERIKTLKKQEEARQNYNMYSESSHVVTYYGKTYGDEVLSRSEIDAYLNGKLYGLWNTTAIDNDSSLTESQKEQLRIHARIYGD